MRQMMHAPGASGRTSGKVRKPLEFLMFSACAPFGRGIRFTQKDTVSRNPSKRWKMKQNQQIRRAGKDTVNCRRDRAGMGALLFPRRTSENHWEMKVFTSASAHSVLRGQGEGNGFPKKKRFPGILQNHWKMKQIQQYDRAGKDTVNCWQEARLP